jgi:predicted homoserine dehydrogenase-like protein
MTAIILRSIVMIYSSLYRQAAGKGPVNVGLIGTGHYGTAVLTQSVNIPLLHVAAIADSNLEAAKRAYALAGISGDDIVICSNRAEAMRALPKRRIIVEDPLLLMELPLDVIAESTGSPEAGARHALEAIRHGKHVAMISKEPDSVVGPILRHLAEQAGVVYSQVDGDQHGLMIGWVNWLRSLGLEILAAGKARDLEMAYKDDFSSARGAWNPNSTSSAPHDTIAIAPEDRKWFGFIPDGESATYLAERHRVLQSMACLHSATFDICESVIAINATGLVPDGATMHDPVVRISEIPRVLCPRSEGGILEKRGVIDVVIPLRGERDGNMGGGVFAVVGCSNDYSRKIIVEKGLWANARESAAVIFRPHHLCGVETPTTLLCAGLLGIPTGNDSSYRPLYDMIITTTREMKAGEILNCEHDPSFKASLIPAASLRSRGPLPAHLSTGRKLKRDIPAGTVLTQDMIELVADSLLFELRRKQDELFQLA